LAISGTSAYADLPHCSRECTPDVPPRAIAVERPGQWMWSMPNSQCPFCEHLNPAAAKFCNDCGSPLHLKPCRACDAINDGSVKFCYMCGAPFAERASDSAVAVLRAHRMAAASRGGSTSSDAGNTVSERGPGAEQAPARRGPMALLLPAVIFGAIAIGIYLLAYRNVLPLKDWASATWAAVSPNRATTAAPAAAETSGASTATAPPTVSATLPTTPAGSTPPSLQAMAAPPAQAVPSEPAPPAPVAPPAAKKASTSNKAVAKKTRNSAAKKSTPATSRTTPTPATGPN
jgi:hypothetical protein